MAVIKLRANPFVGFMTEKGPTPATKVITKIGVIHVQLNITKEVMELLYVASSSYAKVINLRLLLVAREKTVKHSPELLIII